MAPSNFAYVSNMKNLVSSDNSDNSDILKRYIHLSKNWLISFPDTVDIVRKNPFVDSSMLLQLKKSLRFDDAAEAK